ncbi:MAG: hypothetical protein HYT76_07790 [Deltaproteobacteria bacterium]|nr:hypothetical protein [Deltaproteobacteria bacterium]
MRTSATRFFTALGLTGLASALAVGAWLRAQAQAEQRLRGTKRVFLGENPGGDVFLMAEQSRLFPPSLDGLNALRFEIREGDDEAILVGFTKEGGRQFWEYVRLPIDSLTDSCLPISGIALVTYCPSDWSDGCLFGAYILTKPRDSHQVQFDSYSGIFNESGIRIYCEARQTTTLADEAEEEFVFRAPNPLEDRSEEVKEEDRGLVVVGTDTGRTVKLSAPKLVCPEMTYNPQND